MINFLLVCYIALLALFVWLGVVRLNLFWKLSPVLVLLLLMVGLFIPMQWGAPSGPVAVARNSVQIIPSVAGEVVEVPVAANVPLKAGDVLFRIDPTTYQAQVRAIEAQLRFAELRLSEMTQLRGSGAGRAFDVEQRQAEAEQLRAQLDAARWDLDRTTVRAPSDGYVTNLALRAGARVTTQSPAMAFIDTSETIFGVEIPQAFARHVQAGQRIEATFKVFPGEVHAGRVEAVLQAIASGQVQPGGLAVSPADVRPLPFAVRIVLDDPGVARRLPAGSTGTAAIFTDRVATSHVIRRVLLRQTAILNYVNPF
ncbi:HlyD family secretion protein [Falsiroseomonas sp. HW251]|uniref:HlyD family secretion protein n=1 Tax=Falsiroseomonas sp. HW251 TaxID=3390998 RepID=UPI003D32462A